MKISIEIKALLLAAAIFAMSCNPEGLGDDDIAYKGISTYTFEKGIVIYEPGWKRIMYLKATPDLASFSELYRVEEGERLSGTESGNGQWILPGRGENASSEFLVMSVPIDPKDRDRTETLLRINVDDGTVIRYPVNSMFDKIGFDSGSTYAVMYHGGDLEGANLSEIALINLTKPRSETNPSIMSIRLGGRPIDRIFFAPPLSIGPSSGSADRRLAIFSAEGAVRVVDLATPETGAVTIPITTEEETGTVKAVQILTRDGDSTRDTKIFVRAEGSEDIYCISLFAKGDGSTELAATVSLLEAGSRPLDMVVVEDGETPLLVALGTSSSGSSKRILTVVNIDTEDFFHVEIDDAVDNAVLRTAGREVILFGDETRAVYYLKVDGLASEKESNLSEVPIPDGIGRVEQIDGNRLLIDSMGTSDLIVFDMDTKFSIRLSGVGGYSWDPLSTSIIRGDKLFIAPPGDDKLYTLDMATGHADELLLDEAISTFHLLSDSGAGVVLHDMSTGRATVFSLDSPTRSDAFVVDGLWLKGFLE